jgi:hypothetical protein
MGISNFNDFLDIARSQLEPQRLLFVFASAELPTDATQAQRAEFEREEGGELTPLMCVDKAGDELESFDALVSEATLAGPPWSIVFTAALSGGNGTAPSSLSVDSALQKMVHSIKTGQLQALLPFDRNGFPVRFN